MAAVLPTIPASGQERAKVHLGDRHERYLFPTLAAGDTWAVPGGTARIRDFAWQPVGNAVNCRWVKTNATTMTFFTASGTACVLHLWVRR